MKQKTPMTILIDQLNAKGCDLTPKEDSPHGNALRYQSSKLKTIKDDWGAATSSACIDDPRFYNYICYGINEYEQENYNLYN